MAAVLLAVSACSPTVAPTPSTASTAPSNPPTSPSPLPTPPPSPPPTPATAQIRTQIVLPSDPGAYPQTPYPDQLAVTDGAIWIVWWHTDPIRLIRVDVAAGKISASVKLPYPVQLTADDGGLWATGPYGSAPSPAWSRLFRVNLTSGKLTELAPIRHSVRGFVAGVGWLWVEADGKLLRLNETSGERTAAFDAPQASDYAIGCGALWALASDGENTELARLDPATGAVLAMVETHFYDAVPRGSAERCWLISPSSVQRLSGDVIADPTIADTEVFGADPTVWTLSGTVIRRVNLETGLPVEAGWQIDRDLLDEGGKAGHLTFVDAGGFLWLLNRDQVVRFDIPTS